MAVVERDTVIGEGAALDDLSCLPTGMMIPDGERWTGSPARPEPVPMTARQGCGRRARRSNCLSPWVLLAMAIVLPLAEVPADRAGASWV